MNSNHTQFTRLQSVFWYLFLMLGLLANNGCQRTSRDFTLDETQAKDACTRFLTAWKEGKAVDALKPGIIGRDIDWDQGIELTSFEFQPGETSDGTNLHLPVKLDCKNKNGMDSTSIVVYVIGTSPVVTIF